MTYYVKKRNKQSNSDKIKIFFFKKAFLHKMRAFSCIDDTRQLQSIQIIFRIFIL